MSDEYNEGWDAYWNDRGPNPYELRSTKSYDWADGWLAAFNNDMTTDNM